MRINQSVIETMAPEHQMYIHKLLEYIEGSTVMSRRWWCMVHPSIIPDITVPMWIAISTPMIQRDTHWVKQ